MLAPDAALGLLGLGGRRQRPGLVGQAAALAGRVERAARAVGRGVEIPVLLPLVLGRRPPEGVQAVGDEAVEREERRGRGARGPREELRAEAERLGLCGIPIDSRYLQLECSGTNFWGLSL